jgi:hypothetical protein
MTTALERVEYQHGCNGEKTEEREGVHRTYEWLPAVAVKGV